MTPRLTARGLIADVRLVLAQLREPTLALWALYLVTTPIYLWRSGLPQIGDMLLVVIAPMVLFQRRAKLPGSHERSVRSLYYFTAWVILVNLGWTMILGPTLTGKTTFLLAPIFYVYNAVVYLVFLVMYQRYGSQILHLTAKLVLYTLLSQVFIAFFLVSGSHRAILLFNNPNQLGYYALLSASLLVVLQRRHYCTTIEVAIGSLAATYLALLSASKAAIGGILILALVATIARFRTMLAVGLVLLPLMFIPNPMLDALDRTLSRFETDVSLPFIEERGYDRVFEHPEYWLLGAGEGNYRRFDDGLAIGSHEIHSSLGTLFFCYGIVGTVMFAVFVLSVLRRSGMRTWLLLMPSLAYGMTHQALRTTLFWVLLAIIVILRSEDHQDRANRLNRSAARSAA